VGTLCLPDEVLNVCARQGVEPTQFILVVLIARQQTALFEWVPPSAGEVRNYVLQNLLQCSSSKFGVGEQEGSNRTPRGLHRIVEKIGAGLPVGTVFRGRKPVGLMAPGETAAAITTRILWLEGLEPGLNRCGSVDSHARYIYIHGTGDETALGRPDSHGCIHLAAVDLIPLFEKVPSGTLVWISENQPLAADR
jgi:hypothetical protein